MIIEELKQAGTVEEKKALLMEEAREKLEGYRASLKMYGILAGIFSALLIAVFFFRRLEPTLTPVMYVLIAVDFIMVGRLYQAAHGFFTSRHMSSGKFFSKMSDEKINTYVDMRIARHEGFDMSAKAPDADGPAERQEDKRV